MMKVRWVDMGLDGKSASARTWSSSGATAPDAPTAERADYGEVVLAQRQRVRRGHQHGYSPLFYVALIVGIIGLLGFLLVAAGAAGGI